MKTILQQIDDALGKLQSLELELTASGIEHVELFEKVKSQEKQLQQLIDEKQELSRELQSCQERLCLLETQLSKWDDTTDILAENLVLISENEELKTENENLQTNGYALDENMVLTDENANLKEENVCLQEEIVNLQKQQQETMEENQLLATQNEEMKIQIQTCEKEIEELRENNTAQNNQDTLSEGASERVNELFVDEENVTEQPHQSEEPKPNKKRGKARKNASGKDSTESTNQLFFDFMDM